MNKADLHNTIYEPLSHALDATLYLANNHPDINVRKEWQKISNAIGKCLGEISKMKRNH